MRAWRMFGIFLLISLVTLAGCSEDDEDKTPSGPSSDAGSLTAGSDGANTVIAAENKDAFAGIMKVKTDEIMAYAMQDMEVAYKVANTAATISGRHDGSESGYAQLSGSMTSSLTSHETNITCTLYDYSDDGELYLGGAINYVITYNLTTEVSTTTVNAAVKFAGMYSGTMTYTINMSVNPETYETTYSGTYTIESGGATQTGSFVVS